MGGMIAAIENCFPQREIQDAAYRYQQAIERGEQIIVGVNKFTSEEPASIETLSIEAEVAQKQRLRLKEVRASRSQSSVDQCLSDLRHGT